MAKKTLDEINEETELNLKVNREKRWEDGQLDRIEEKVDRIEDSLRNIGFFGGVMLLIILGMIWKF